MPASAPLAALASPALRLQTDARLVTLSREGHRRAFEEIVRRYRDPLVRFAGAIVPADRAEDVVQEAFTRAHAAIIAGDSELALRPWLYRVVRNGALNDLRDHHSHEELDPEYDGVPQPPDIAARSEELATTVAAINALPAAQRDALVKRELEGRGHDEIAADLGVSPGAVRQLIFRARTALRDGLGSLIPLPVLRAVLAAGPAETGAAASTGAGAAALGIAGGGGVAVKAGAAALVALAVGSGLSLRDDHRRSPDHTNAAIADATPGAHARDHAGTDAGRRSEGDDPTGGGQSERGGGSDGGDRGDAAGGGHSGPGGGHSGPGGGHSGPGGGSGSGSSGPGGGEHSGPGGGGGNDDAAGEDHSGPGGGDGGSSGPGDGGGTDGADNSGPGGGGGDLAEPNPEPDHSGPGDGGDDSVDTERHGDAIGEPAD